MPILYGVWHIHRRLGGGRALLNGRTIPLQMCRQYSGGGNNRRSDSYTKALKYTNILSRPNRHVKYVVY